MKKPNQKNHTLPLSTQVKVIAWHKVTDRKVEKIMLFGEWLNLKKDSKWVYKCLQVDE